MNTTLSPETLAGIIVAGAVASIIFLVWRLWWQLRYPGVSSLEGPTWDPSGDNEIWLMYNKWRDTQLAIKYLVPRISRLNMISRTIDIIIAVATGTSVSSFALSSQYSWSADAWKWFAGLGALLAVIRPVVGLQDMIKRRQDLLTAYSVFSSDCEKITYLSRLARKYDASSHQLFQQALDLFEQSTKNLVMERAEVANLDEEKKRGLKKSVEKEFPTDRSF
jgi:hypothetical protein